jgi:hypothetical protein
LEKVISKIIRGEIYCKLEKGYAKYNSGKIYCKLENITSKIIRGQNLTPIGKRICQI